jgi:hypothetical protein
MPERGSPEKGTEMLFRILSKRSDHVSIVIGISAENRNIHKSVQYLQRSEYKLIVKTYALTE